MTRLHLHPESHLVSRIGWLRAAVLGANDGIVSTASLIVGVAAASAASSDILIAGVAGLVAGAMSMAAGEYVSVSSQSDTERADLARERAELASQPDFEREELAQIYVKRGLEPKLARKVADQLTEKDALGAHARDELGISEVTAARPVAGGADLRGNIRRGRGDASLDGPCRTAIRHRSRRFNCFPGISCAAWCCRSAGRWRGRHQGNVARHILGCNGDGLDRWDRGARWHRGLAMGRLRI